MGSVASEVMIHLSILRRLNREMESLRHNSNAVRKMPDVNPLGNPSKILRLMQFNAAVYEAYEELEKEISAEFIAIVNIGRQLTIRERLMSVMQEVRNEDSCADVSGSERIGNG